MLGCAAFLAVIRQLGGLRTAAAQVGKLPDGGGGQFLQGVEYGTVRPRHGLMNPGSRIPAQAFPRASYSPAGMVHRRIGEDFQRAGNVLVPWCARVGGLAACCHAT